MLTVVIPSFYSSKLVEERIHEINNNVPIIIIENSRDQDFKKKIEKTFDNVRVIIPDKNLGFGKALNLGYKEAKTKMVFFTQPDVKLIENCIDKLIECVKEFKDFAIITPNDTNNEIFTNYEVYNKYEDTKNQNQFLLKEVDYVDITWLVNKDNFDADDIWDEKIFLYFEAKDFL